MLALRHVNSSVEALQPLQVTIGDEFQGAYATLGEALLAALLVRLELLPGVDTRYGVGWGGLTVFDADREPVSQDGPAWWAAREAITYVKHRSPRSGHSRRLRTWFVDRGGDRWPPEAAGRSPDGPMAPGCAPEVNAFLLCRDELLASYTPRSLRLLHGWLLGRTQSAMADDEGISQPAVSQQLASSGAYAIRDAHAALRDAPR